MYNVTNVKVDNEGIHILRYFLRTKNFLMKIVRLFFVYIYNIYYLLIFSAPIFLLAFIVLRTSSLLASVGTTL